jgi:hypothetical protein
MIKKLIVTLLFISILLPAFPEDSTYMDYLYQNKKKELFQENMGYNIPQYDIEFLDMVEKDSYKYFSELRNPKTGLVPDSSAWGSPCSIAGMGFTLSILCIADHRGWLKKEEANAQALLILKTFTNKVQGFKGFFYHFVDPETGERAWKSELSSIDTALFLAGALFAGEYFGGDVKKLSQRLYENVDWMWMTNGKKAICLGWLPDYGFLNSYWSAYSEHMILYALAIGSSDKNIPPGYWYEWLRHTGEYDNKQYVYAGTGSLFVYQYSHAWIDFRQVKDKKIDWWANSVKATITNRQFCIDHANEFKTYNENCWGVSASLGPGGYKGYGVQVGYYPEHDGTVAPCAVAGSLPFLPRECISALKYMYDNYKDNLYRQYGFADAFNLDQEWYAEDFLAIDQGITVMMIENFRSQLMWKYFMKLPFVIAWNNMISAQ